MGPFELNFDQVHRKLKKKAMHGKNLSHLPCRWLYWTIAPPVYLILPMESYLHAKA